VRLRYVSIRPAQAQCPECDVEKPEIDLSGIQQFIVNEILFGTVFLLRRSEASFRWLPGPVSRRTCPLQPIYSLMTKPAKSSRRNRRNRKQPTQSSSKTGRQTLEKARDTKSTAARPGAVGARNRQHGDNERIRTLWERKQAQLEARWLAAQARQTSEEMARRRNAKILRGATGIAALAILLCALVLYYAYGAHIPGLPGGDGA
jgi:hypothetical protein